MKSWRWITGVVRGMSSGNGFDVHASVLVSRLALYNRTIKRFFFR